MLRTLPAALILAAFLQSGDRGAGGRDPGLPKQRLRPQPCSPAAAWPPPAWPVRRRASTGCSTTPPGPPRPLAEGFVVARPRPGAPSGLVVAGAGSGRRRGALRRPCASTTRPPKPSWRRSCGDDDKRVRLGLRRDRQPARPPLGLLLRGQSARGAGRRPVALRHQLRLLLERRVGGGGPPLGGGMDRRVPHSLRRCFPSACRRTPPTCFSASISTATAPRRGESSNWSPRFVGLGGIVSNFNDLILPAPPGCAGSSSPLRRRRGGQRRALRERRLARRARPQGRAGRKLPADRDLAAGLRPGRGRPFAGQPARLRAVPGGAPALLPRRARGVPARYRPGVQHPRPLLRRRIAFYSRRIGRAPRGRLPLGATPLELPETTTILAPPSSPGSPRAAGRSVSSPR